MVSRKNVRKSGQEDKCGVSVSARDAAQAGRGVVREEGRGRRGRSPLQASSFLTTYIYPEFQLVIIEEYSLRHIVALFRIQPHQIIRFVGVCGPMDKAPVYGTGDSRFDPWQTHLFYCFCGRYIR
jgi:hypothetical protein